MIETFDIGVAEGMVKTALFGRAKKRAQEAVNEAAEKALRNAIRRNALPIAATAAATGATFEGSRAATRSVIERRRRKKEGGR